MRVASVGAIAGMLIACESSPIATVPLVSAVTAVTSGSAMPSNDPKAIRMMIAAAMMPKISLFAGGVWLTSAIALPPSSTCRPGARTACARLMTRLMSADGRFCASLVKSTVAKAVLPSRLI